MIVRIASEGQYKLSSATLDKINELDNRLVAAVASNDSKEFDKLFSQMLSLVRKQGKPVGVEELLESDIIIPAPDTTLHEARHLFQAEGLFPG